MSREPLPSALVAAMVQTEKICESLRYFSMMPLQLSRPNPWEVWDLSSSMIIFVSKRCSSWSLVMPLPVSSTAIST